MTVAGDAAGTGIWTARSLAKTPVPVQFRFTLGEADTPLEPARTDAGLLLKREDLNPTGSHKDRAACFQLARALTARVPGVVISSSGNAGVATSRYAEAAGVPAIVCVHPDTEPAKLAALDGSTTTVVISERTINSARRISVALGLPNLRPSRDDDAVEAYSGLGEEVVAAGVDDVVLFATSGATAVAVAQVAVAAGGPAVHVVQGEGNDWLANPEADREDAEARGAAAGRLGVRKSARAAALRKAVAATGGTLQVATHAEVAQARVRLEELGIAAGDESAANVAIATRLRQRDPSRRVAVVISGAPPVPRGRHPLGIVRVADEFEALAAFDPRKADAARTRANRRRVATPAPGSAQDPGGTP